MESKFIFRLTTEHCFTILWICCNFMSPQLKIPPVAFACWIGSSFLLSSSTSGLFNECVDGNGPCIWLRPFLYRFIVEPPTEEKNISKKIKLTASIRMSMNLIVELFVCWLWMNYYTVSWHCREFVSPFLPEHDLFMPLHFHKTT